MQYLPIYPEKSWAETVLTPTQQISYKGDWGENLPLTYGTIDSSINLYNQVGGGVPGIYPMVVGGVGTPFMMLTDALGTMGNTVYNGYKRAYNYGANAYNNLADKYNNRQMQRHLNYAPGNSNTGRRIVGQPIIPTLQQNLPTRPTRYLVGSNGNIVAQIID